MKSIICTEDGSTHKQKVNVMRSLNMSVTSLEEDHYDMRGDGCLDGKR